MPFKDKEKQKKYNRKYQKKYYKKNKKYYKDKAKERKIELQRFVYRVFSLSSCNQCGEGRIPCLHFHHKEPDNKFKSVIKMAQNGYSIDRIKDEMRKCEILCANCHAIENSINQEWYKKLK